MNWWRKFFSSDNSEVNTGAVIATIAALNAMLILNWNFFVYHKPLDTGTVGLLGTLVGLGGWAYRSSMLNIPRPPLIPPPPLPRQGRDKG